MLAMPAMRELRGSADLHLLIAVLRDIRADARARADKAWTTHKAPMALYWKAVSVYAGHLARALNTTDDVTRDREPEALRGKVQGGGIHADHMRLDRVRRHTESPATFPAGEDA